MNTPSITEQEFREFLNEEYLFPDQVQEDGDAPIVLDDGTYYGNKEDIIFRFQIQGGKVISLEDTEPEQIPLEDIDNPNSSIDSLFQSWLTNDASRNYARRWITSFCKSVEIQSLSKNQHKAIGNMFTYTNVPWITCFNWISSTGHKEAEQVAGCQFILMAIKSGISPWSDWSLNRV